MFAFSKIGIAAVVLTTGLFAAGCQSNGASTPKEMSAMGPAITCEKCKTTWVKTPIISGSNKGQGSQIVGYRSGTTMECPDCRNIATSFFQQGKTTVPGSVVHSCKTCGGDMVACDAH